MFKKIFFTIVCLMLAIPSVSLAARDFGLPATGKGAGFATEGTQANVYLWVNQVVSAFLSIVSILFLVLIVYAGVRWMTARDNEKFVEKAKEIMSAAIIGLIITIASYAISNFVFGILIK